MTSCLQRVFCKAESWNVFRCFSKIFGKLRKSSETFIWPINNTQIIFGDLRSGNSLKIQQVARVEKVVWKGKSCSRYEKFPKSCRATCGKPYPGATLPLPTPTTAHCILNPFMEGNTNVLVKWWFFTAIDLQVLGWFEIHCINHIGPKQEKTSSLWILESKQKF